MLVPSRELYISYTMEMKKFYAFNKIERMPPGAVASLAKHVRGQAKNAWLRADLPLQPERRYGFELYVALQKGCGIVPDADSVLWIAKRVLDGARDAKIIRNDGLRYIASTTAFTARYVACLPCLPSYVGALARPAERKVQICL